MRIGAIWLGVNRALAPREKAYILEDAGAKLLVTDQSGFDQVNGLSRRPRKAA
jgi:acyl-coenzyme A synthetase/AMP-(fatty) acid ligase